MRIDKELKKRFVKDFKLPINIFEDEYFDYFIDLYDNLLNTKYKLNLFKEALNNADDRNDFFNYGANLANNIRSQITDTEAYKKLITVDMNKEYPLKEDLAVKNIYTEENQNKELVSIDLIKANFNVLNLLNIKKELNVNSYDELIKKNTDLEYYLKSKMFRQIIFGSINPNRQQRLQKYVINQIAKLLNSENYNLFSASSDEIILENKGNIKQLYELLETLPEEFKFFRVETFNINKINEHHDFFVKKSYNKDMQEKIEFKNVPSYLFAQVFKEYYGLELNNNDMCFMYEGFLVEFKDPVFKKEIKKTPKLNIKK